VGEIATFVDILAGERQKHTNSLRRYVKNSKFK
jgi:hypothetical protein